MLAIASLCYFETRPLYYSAVCIAIGIAVPKSWI
jgi:hypothetical protein